MKKTPHWLGAQFIAPWLILLLAFSLGLWRLETESIWHDEAWSIRAIDSPFGTPDDNTPPIYYLILHLLQGMGAGHSPFALRYGSVLLNLFTVALAFRIGQNWYKLGYLAGALVGLSPLLWEYSQEVRAYIAVPIFALLFLMGAEAHRDTPKTWLYFFLVELLGLYTHNLVVPLIVWLNMVLFGFWVWGNSQIPPLKWLALQCLIFICYLPWLLTQSPSGTNLNTVPKFGRELSQDLWRGYIFPVVSDPERLPRDFLTLVHLLPFLAGMALLILAWRGRNRRSLLILSQVILLPIFSTLLLQRASIDFHPRYYILAVPSTMLLLVAALGSLPQKFHWGGAAIVLGVSAFITHYSLNFIAEHPEYQHDDFRGLAEYYADLPADVVILIPFDDEPALQYYYQRELDIQAQFLNIPLYSPPPIAIEKINAIVSAPQVELLTWYQVPADIRGMYGCLLGAGSQIGEAFTTYGLHSQAYLNPKPVQMTILDRWKVNFQAAKLDKVIYSRSESQTCIINEWYDNPPHELKTTVTLYNPFGEVISKTDSFILDERQQISVSGNSFSLLELPQGLPTKPYQIGITLYSETEPSGYDLIDPETGKSLGKTHWENVNLPYTPFENIPLQPTLNNTFQQPLYSGSHLDLEIISPAGDIPIRLEGENWTLEDEITVENPSLVWHSFQIPPEASGTASLYFNAIHLADYTIILTERLWEAPPTELEIETNFGGVATLVGANLAQTPQTIRIDLVWQALQIPKDDYWVFAQILDADGKLLAQSDAEPIRPTSSWIPNEYILDSHSIKLDSVNYTGEASVIVGLYNPRDGERLQVAEENDFVTLPIEIILGDD